MATPSPTILFTGVSGFLGRHLRHISPTEGEVFIGTYHQNEVRLPNVACEQLDIMDKTGFESLLQTHQPDAVVHLAALSNPNYCELHPDENNQINTEAPFHMAGVCHRLGILFVFASTDLVFDGQHPPYPENHATNALMAYGQAKAKTEHLLTILYPQTTLIARLPLLYGWDTDTKNFMTSWIQTLQAGQPIKAFTDEYRTAAWAGDVMTGLVLLATKGQPGIYHLGGTERMSRFDFAVLMATVYGLDKSLVQPVLQKEVQMPAARPGDVSLESGKAMTLGFEAKKAEHVLRYLRDL